MHFDFAMAAGSFLVAIVVGLTGMGGGALMTPMLTVFFGVPPLTAVSSDLVAAAVMKPVGSLVHLRRGTVDLRLVGRLCAGSVPAAFCGVLLARALGGGDGVQQVITTALGVALLIAAAGLVLRTLPTSTLRRLLARDGGRRDAGATAPVTVPTTPGATRATAEPAPFTGHADRVPSTPGAPAAVANSDAPVETKVRTFPTVLVGIIGGLVVGMTSVGSGSLIIVALLALYPRLSLRRLVGTDLLQAVPLVWSAALGHILFGDFRLEVTAALLAGSIPGVYLGSLASSRAPGGPIRTALVLVLLASALKMFGVGTGAMAWILVASAATAALAWTLTRGRRTAPIPEES